MTATRPGPAATSIYAAQWWLFYGVVVSNKTAEFAQQRMEALFPMRPGGSWQTSPFNQVRDRMGMHTRRDLMMQWVALAKTGQYNRVEAAFRGIVKMADVSNDDPRAWDLDWLEEIPGIGPKTARWFFGLCHAEARVAAIDTHVLKFLADNGVPSARRKGTPPAGAIYRKLEAAFLARADSLGLRPTDLDTVVWAVYRNGGKILIGGNR